MSAGEKLVYFDPDIQLFGPLDENLKLLEAQFNVQIRTSSTEIIVEGDSDDVDKAERVLGQLTSMMDEGYKLGKGDVKTAAQLVAQDENVARKARQGPAPPARRDLRRR